jgi:hypothetical protein
MGEALRGALEALGVRTVGGVAALAPGEVEARWGAEGVAVWRLARGEDARRPGVVRVVAERVASVELPMAVERVEPLRFLVRAQLERVVAECVRDGRAVAAVAVTLALDGGTRAGCVRTVTREVRPARPVARLEPLFRQCWALLEEWRLPAPVAGVAVSVPATAPLAADQGDLLVPSWRDAAGRADAVCARLRAVLDPGGTGLVVVHPVAEDAHRPEGTGRWVAADPLALGAAPVPSAPVPSAPAPSAPAPAAPAPAVPAPAVPAWPSASSGVVREAPGVPYGVVAAGGAHAAPVAAVLRLLPVPEVIQVEQPHGCPEALWWRGGRLALTAVHGPERLDGAWWRGAADVRDYWRGVAEGEGELLFYHQPGAGWYLQGWYD